MIGRLPVAVLPGLFVDREGLPKSSPSSWFKSSARTPSLLDSSLRLASSNRVNPRTFCPSSSVGEKERRSLEVSNGSWPSGTETKDPNSSSEEEEMEGKREWEVEEEAVGPVEAEGEVEGDILRFGGKREDGEEDPEEVRMSR